jgi:hypothetical protein
MIVDRISDMAMRVLYVVKADVRSRAIGTNSLSFTSFQGAPGRCALCLLLDSCLQKTESLLQSTEQTHGSKRGSKLPDRQLEPLLSSSLLAATICQLRMHMQLQHSLLDQHNNTMTPDDERQRDLATVDLTVLGYAPIRLNRQSFKKLGDGAFRRR